MGLRRLSRRGPGRSDTWSDIASPASETAERRRLLLDMNATLHLRRAGVPVSADSTSAQTPARTPIETHRGEPIVTLADWHRLAPPTSPHHWREYRSAFELAHAWTEGDGAERLSAVLKVREELAGVRLERGIAERKSWFDDIPGRPRQHDLLLIGGMNAGRLVVGLEAKADEPFDLDVAE